MLRGCNVEKSRSASFSETFLNFVGPFFPGTTLIIDETQTSTILPEPVTLDGMPAMPCPARNDMTTDMESAIAGLLLENGDFHPLNQTLCLGRAADCDVVLDDRRVSRRHAAIHCESGSEYWISDLGGLNGVYVNEQRVNPASRLRNGDVIRILNHTLRFTCATQSEPAAEVPGSPDQTVSDCSVQERWLLVGDIRDAVGLGTRCDAGQYRLQIETWMRASRSAVARHGGHINNFTGDGFLASWPWASDSSTQVVRALERFRAMRDFVPFRFRLALHFGEVMVGGWGSPCEEGLLGREVNFVFRMEKVAAEHDLPLLISSDAIASSFHLPDVRPTGPLTVPGYAGDYEFFTEV